MRILLKFFALIAVSAWALPAHAEVVETSASAFVTRHTAVVNASAREAWLMLISPDKWWNSAHTFSGDSANLMLTPQAGECFCERIPAEDNADRIGLAGSVEHMNVLLAIPDMALRMRGSLGPLQSEAVSGILTITLAETDIGTAKATDIRTRITFEYVVGGYMRFETPLIATLVDGVMGQQLSGLSNQLGPSTLSDAANQAEESGGAQPPRPVKESDAAAAEDVSDTDIQEAGEKDPLTVEEAFSDISDVNNTQ